MHTKIDRRRFLFTAGASAIVAGAPPWSAAMVKASTQSAATAESRADAVLRAFDAQGVHRTGTEVDRVSGEWLRLEAERAGGAARVERFDLERLDIDEAFVEVEGRRIKGLPFFDGGITDAAGITDAFGPAGIHLATADRAAVGTEGGFLAQARRVGARAIVVITDGDKPGLVPSNARSAASPYGCPVLQVPSDARTTLEAAQRAGTRVRVVCAATRRTTAALNVVADVAGRVAGAAPILIITPRSGWWVCAAERGGGIACWLEALRALAVARLDRRAIFVASSGHELGHLGLDAFLHANEPLIRGAYAWIHLGANIGSGAPGTTPRGVRLQASHDDLDQEMTSALAKAEASLANRLPRGQVPSGEARNLHVGGARYVSLIGQDNPWFHHPDDRYRTSVTAAVVARYATAVSAVAAQLAQTPG
jgi:hypothetical protein